MDERKDVSLIARDELFAPQKLGGGGRYVKAMSVLLPQIAKKEHIRKFILLFLKV